MPGVLLTLIGVNGLKAAGGDAAVGVESTVRHRLPRKELGVILGHLAGGKMTSSWQQPNGPVARPVAQIRDGLGPSLRVGRERSTPVEAYFDAEVDAIAELIGQLLRTEGERRDPTPVSVELPRRRARLIQDWSGSLPPGKELLHERLR